MSRKHILEYSERVLGQDFDVSLDVIVAGADRSYLQSTVGMHSKIRGQGLMHIQSYNG